MYGILLAALAAQIITLNAPNELMVGEPASLVVTEGGRPLAGVEVRVAGAGRVRGVVRVELLSVRAGAVRTAVVRASLYRGESVLVVEEGADGWCRVTTQVGMSGFCACEFLERARIGRTLGRTDEAGRLSLSALGVVPGLLSLSAMREEDELARADVVVKPFEYDRREVVAPGIAYRERRVVKGADGPFTFQILEVDPKHPAVNVLPVRARDRAIGRETVSGMARRLGATAAVNGGYFLTTGPYAGGSSGVYLSNGEVVGTPAGDTPHTALVFCAEKSDIERLEFEAVGYAGEVRSSTGSTAKVTGLHRARGPEDLIVYRPMMGERTLTDAAGVEARIDSQGVVLDLAEGAGDVAIPRDGYVLSGAGGGAEWLRGNARPGARITLELGLKASSCAAADITGGGPRLVRGGKVDLGEEAFAHEKVRHPRTAVGVTAAGALLFLTLDGRQARSAGMTLRELAEALIELGAVEAMNLDGGGSTAMVVRDEIRNSPSDGRERAVSDAILIYSVASEAELAQLRSRIGLHPLGDRVLPEAERGVQAISSFSARTRE
ncbi:MAG TPA: phosphodiester glycosidase family protein [Paludibaculum sp.]